MSESFVRAFGRAGTHTKRPSVRAITRLIMAFAARGLGIAALAVGVLFVAPAGAQWTERLELEHGAFPRRDAPEAIVHAGPAFRADAPLHLVVFLHGYRGCIEVLAGSGDVACRTRDRVEPGWELMARHDQSGDPSLLIFAQLAFRARSGNPGAFAREGGFRGFLEEVLGSLAPRIGRRTLSQVGRITLLAHSAAFATTLAILRAGEVTVRNIVLFDALYAGERVFYEWARQSRSDAPRTLVSFHGGRGTTGAKNELLARWARRDMRTRAQVGRRATIEAASDHALVVVRSRWPHAEIPGRHYVETLRALAEQRR